MAALTAIGRDAWLRLGLIVLCAGAWPSVPAWAAQPFAERVPAAARLFISCPDLGRWEAGWNRTAWAALLGDPKLTPFLKQARGAEDRSSGDTQRWLGFGWSELRAAAAGEVALAVVPTDQSRAATLVLIDTQGKAAEAAACLTEADRYLSGLGSRKTSRTVAGGQAVIHDIAASGQGTQPWQRAYCRLGDVLVIGDRISAVESLAARWQGKAQPSLAENAAYRQTLALATTPVEGVEPNVRWFLDPLGLARLLAESSNTDSAPRGRDWLATATRLGCDSVGGIGGVVVVGHGDSDFVHRTTVLMPRPFRKALGVFAFLPSSSFEPPAWLDQELAEYLRFDWDYKQVVQGYGDLFDELSADGEQGVFQDLLEGMRTDPNGPRVDLKRELFWRLGPDTLLVHDFRGERNSANPRGSRYLVAARLASTQEVKQTLERFYQGDPGIRRFEAAGCPVWTTTTPDGSLFAEGSDRTLPNFTTVTLSDHELILATDQTMVTDALTVPAGREPLLRSGDFTRVAERLAKWRTPQTSLREFTHASARARPTINLLREGKLGVGDCWEAWLLLRWLAGPGGIADDRASAAFRTLPEFDVLRDYFCSGGLTVDASDQGWQVVGFRLARSPQP